MLSVKVAKGVIHYLFAGVCLQKVLDKWGIKIREGFRLRKTHYRLKLSGKLKYPIGYFGDLLF